MQKILKRIGVVLGSLLGIILLAGVGLYFATNSRMNKTYEIVADDLNFPQDETSLAIGEHWVEIHCETCHAPDLGGGPFYEDAKFGYADAPNLTSGEGGIGKTYTNEDWVLALRHGVKKNGTSVFIMPSDSYYYLSDEDLSGIISYIKTVPPINREIRSRSLSPIAKILYALGAFGDLLFAETIQHEIRPESPKVGNTLAYGDYLLNINGCRSCHGNDLSGKKPSEPGAPLAPNLTPGGLLANWSEEDFFDTMRTGINPYNYELSDSMPWKGMANMTDDELRTIWQYLQSLPSLETSVE